MPHFEFQILTSLQLQKRCRCQRVHLHLNKRKESERELRPDSVWVYATKKIPALKTKIIRHLIQKSVLPSTLLFSPQLCLHLQ